MTKPEDLPQLVLSALHEVVPEAAELDLDDAESLRLQLDVDSMDILNFAIAIHAQTGIDIPERDYPKLDTIRGTLEYLRRR